MRKLLLFIGICAVAQAQTIFRVDPIPVMTTSGTAPVGGYPALYAVAGASIQITYDAAGTMPATTYASQAGNVTCPSGSPVVLPGTSVCTPYAGSQGQFGFWLSSTLSNTYYFTVTSNGVTSGPFPLTINTPGVTQLIAGTGITLAPSNGIGNVTINSTGSIPLTSAYNWGPIASASVLTMGNAFTLTLAPVPLGVNAANPSYSMEITACSGGNQTVAITGGTAVSGAASGTVIFTPSASCAAGFQIASASGGLQEGICAMPSTGGEIYINNAPTLYQNVGVCGKTDVSVLKLAGSTVTGAFTILGSNISSLNGNIWVTNNAIITDSGIIFPALTGVMVANGASAVTAQPQLNVNQGGTGDSTLALNGVLFGNGTSPVGAATAGTADQVLVTPHGGGAPVMGQVDVSQAAAVKNALARANGGLNSTSPGTGILRDGTTPAASELSGDVTTSGSNAATVVKVNGAAVPNSQNPVSTNGSGQIVAATVQGNGGKVQLSTGSTTVNHTAIFDANGNTIDSGNTGFALPASSAQLKYLRISPNTGNLTTAGFAAIPLLNAQDYNWSQAPGGTVTPGSTTVTLTPCPLGIAGSLTNTALYISGGTGTAEAALIVSGSCTSGLSTGTITFTAANSHSGAWTIATASGGIQEAINVGGTTSPTIWLPVGTYPVYNAAGPIYIANPVSFQGDGGQTTVTGQTAGAGIFNCVNTCSMDNFQISSASEQTVGAYGVRLAALGGASNTYSHFTRMLFYLLYDCILGVDAQVVEVRGSTFATFAHSGVTVADANAVDGSGDTIIGNTFFGTTLTPDAAVEVTTTGSVTIAQNQIEGSNGATAALAYGVHVNGNQSSGIMITNNDIENTATGCIYFQGGYELISLIGNHCVQFGGIGDPNTWTAITISSNGSPPLTNEGTIAGNIIQGTANVGNVGMSFLNGSAGYDVSGNYLENLGVGISAAAATSFVNIGRNTYVTVTTPFQNSSTSNVVQYGNAVITYAVQNAMTCAPGSGGYCQDCNTTCSAGGSNGTTCVLNSAGWVH